MFVRRRARGASSSAIILDASSQVVALLGWPALPADKRKLGAGEECSHRAEQKHPEPQVVWGQEADQNHGDADRNANQQRFAPEVINIPTIPKHIRHHSSERPASRPWLRL